MTTNILDTFIEVTLHNPDDFLKIKETLTRIGIASKTTNQLFQSCHILHKQGRYYIVHFKELFALDGKNTNISENDIARRNTIASLLYEWDLLDFVDVNNPLKQFHIQLPSLSLLKIVSFKDKKDYILTSKYSIGKKK